MAVLMAAAIAVIGVNTDRVNDTQTVYAAEFTVTEKNAVLYSNDNTKVYTKPDVNSNVVTTIAKDLPVQVTGITSNGWFRINLNGTYYVPGYGLISKETSNNTAGSLGTDIKSLTKGTFSFYKSSEIEKFDEDDIEDMDENTYIKYLDSFLMGYAMLDNCMMQENGTKLKDMYEQEKMVDAKVAAMTMQEYLIRYRNQYFSDSLAGPFRNEKDLKRALNRAIRYDIKVFGTVYRSTSIGSDEEKMTKFVEKIIKRMKTEQGVSFSCRMEYGTYKASDGSETKGWIIEFTKKDSVKNP